MLKLLILKQSFESDGYGQTGGETCGRISEKNVLEQIELKDIAQ